MKTILLPPGGHSATKTCCQTMAVSLSAKLTLLGSILDALTMPHSEIPSAWQDRGEERGYRWKSWVAFVEGSYNSLSWFWSDFRCQQAGRATTMFLGVSFLPFSPLQFLLSVLGHCSRFSPAQMACLQVITKTGVRLHRNLHVCDSRYLLRQNPPQRHRLQFSQVWHSELGDL